MERESLFLRVIVYRVFLFFLFCLVNSPRVYCAVIYGIDERKEVEKIKNISVRQLSESIAMQVYEGHVLGDKYKYFFTSMISLTDPKDRNLCPSERFTHQPSVGSCTGFLITNNVLVTAGHCIVDEWEEVAKNVVTDGCFQNFWVFGHKTHKNKLNFNHIKLENFYECKRVIYATYNTWEDFAVIELDRKVKKRRPLKIRKYSKMPKGQTVFSLGHSQGLPMKYSGASKTNNHPLKSKVFINFLDVFEGASGSPVFNAKTLAVEGIAISGKDDYYLSKENGKECRKINRCKSNGTNCSVSQKVVPYEHAQRITSILKYLPASIKGILR